MSALISIWVPNSVVASFNLEVPVVETAWLPKHCLWSGLSKSSSLSEIEFPSVSSISITDNPILFNTLGAVWSLIRRRGRLYLTTISDGVVACSPIWAMFNYSSPSFWRGIRAVARRLLCQLELHCPVRVSCLAGLCGFDIWRPRHWSDCSR